MQVQAVGTFWGSDHGFSFISDGLAVVQEGGYLRLLYAQRVDNRMGAITLDALAVPDTPAPGDPVVGLAVGHDRPRQDIVMQQTAAQPRVFVFSDYDGLLRHTTLGATGLPGTTNGTNTDQGYLSGVVAMEIFERGASDIAIVASRLMAGLRLFSVAENGIFTLLSTITDGPKAYLGDVSDIAGLDIEGRSFLLTASALENGLSLYEVHANGTASFVDAMGAEDGIPLAGPAALQSVTMGGVQYVVVASTISSSLTVLRVNAEGVIFLHDHRNDDRSTRFEDVAALDMFSVAGRAFVVAAGTDAGVSVLEVLPDGRLSHITALVLESGAGIANVTGIEVTVADGVALIFLTDARGDRIHRFEIELAQIGGLIAAGAGGAVGSSLDDRILGSAWADTLNGGAGDDFLHDGGASDVLIGGSGADVFVFSKDSRADQITDFQSGVDRLDVSQWGRIYSAQALQITPLASGALVNYGTESLTITRSGGGNLLLTDADFIF